MSRLFFFFYLLEQAGFCPAKGSNMTLAEKQWVHVVPQPNTLPALTVAAFLSSFSCRRVLQWPWRLNTLIVVCQGLLWCFVRPTHSHERCIPSPLFIVCRATEKKNGAIYWEREAVLFLCIRTLTADVTKPLFFISEFVAHPIGFIEMWVVQLWVRNPIVKNYHKPIMPSCLLTVV